MPKEFRPLTILFDIDAILGNLHEIWYRMYNEDYEDDLNVDKVTEWDTSKFAKGGLAVFDYLSVPEVHLNAKPIPGAQDAVEKLFKDGHDLIVCSAACAEPETPSYKIRWLQKHYPWFDRKNVFTGERKELVQADVFIDDSPGQIQKYRKRNPKSSIFTIAYPYNKIASGFCDLYAPGYKNYEMAWEAIYQACDQKAHGSDLWG